MTDPKAATIRDTSVSSDAVAAVAAFDGGLTLTLNGMSAHIAIAVGADAGLGGLELSARAGESDAFRVFATDAQIESLAGTGPIRWVNPEVAGTAAYQTAASKSVALVLGAGLYEVRIRAKRAAATNTTIAVTGRVFPGRVSNTPYNG